MTDSRKTPFLQRRDRWGHGVSLWIVVIVAFLLPLMAWSLRGIRLDNDVLGWLPRDDPQARILQWYEGMFPSKARVLVSWEGASITDPRLEKLQQILEGLPTEDGAREGGSPYVQDVSLPFEVITRMLSRDIPFTTAMEQIDGVLIADGPLKIQLTDAGRIRGDFMQKEILRIANEEMSLNARFVEGTMLPPSSEGIAEDDVRAFETFDALNGYVQNQPLYDLQLEWPDMHADPQRLQELQDALLALEAPGAGAQTAGKPCIATCFFIPGSLAACSVALSEEGEADKAMAIQTLRSALVEAGVPEADIRMGGQAVVNVAMNQAVFEGVWNPDYESWDLPNRSPILFSAFISILFSFIMLRSFRLATLVQAVSFFTVVLAVALVPLTGGTMTMVLIVMPTLLTVLTTSAAIHLSNYWKHSGDPDPVKSVFKAARTAWLPCALASGTTAIGLASLLASNLVPVRDFGIYAAIGCILSFLVVLYVLPSLMLYWPKSPPEPAELNTGHWNRLGLWVVRHRHLVCLLCLALTATASWGLWNFRTETKVIRYFPPESRLVQDYVFLEEKLSGVISIDTIVKFDEAAQQQMEFIDRARKVMELQQEIRRHPEISGVLSLASFIDLRKPDAEMTMVERMKLNRSQKEVGRRIRERVTSESQSDSDGVASMLAIPDFATDWETPGDMALNRAGDEIWRITAQTSALSDTDLNVLIGDMNKIAASHLSLVSTPHTGHVVTGLVPVFLRTQQAVLESLIRSFGMAFVIIAVVMMVLLRSPTSGVITMLPNLMPVLLVFGLLSWMRLKVDIGTMITASVALGIAVDGTLHLLTWFQDLVRKGHPVDVAVGKALEHCGPAMWQTSAAIGLGMLALMPAELLLVSRFGWIMAALVFAALTADIVFLPALLGGTLGRLIQRAVCREQNTASDSASTTVRMQGAAVHDRVSDKKSALRGPSAAQSIAELKDVS
ncbi:MAG: MMPL family transporter [Planctomycetaceae bacterium]